MQNRTFDPCLAAVHRILIVLPCRTSSFASHEMGPCVTGISRHLTEVNGIQLVRVGKQSRLVRPCLAGIVRWSPLAGRSYYTNPIKIPSKPTHLPRLLRCTAEVCAPRCAAPLTYRQEHTFSLPRGFTRAGSSLNSPNTLPQSYTMLLQLQGVQFRCPVVAFRVGV
jgi:hypothetical protein